MEDRSKRDDFFMGHAIHEAQNASLKGEVPIGAVVVCGESIVGRGYNMTETLADATAHAEMQAITAAAGTLGGKYLRECTLYVTVEPCAMCAAACAWSQVGRVVWGADDPKKGYRVYSERIMHPKTVVDSGVRQAECAELMTGFFKKLR